ncbi:MAG TPA: DUF255 domain-containing protein [Gemmatimonadales bacterium]
MLVVLAAGCVAERGPLTNHMSQATTPYLARAARQPVAWQAWGPDAFALAARLDRPVMLYIGADDCRWCAAMDNEVFGDPTVGAMIDSLFVPVRVDRDERPDLAQRYQDALQALAGLRGYPLTLFLTPDGSAFFGGTFFPLDDPITGRGLRQLLPEVARSYRAERPAVLQHAALVRQMGVARTAAARGMLQLRGVRTDIAGVRQALSAAAAAPAPLAGFQPTQAVALLFAEYGRTGDTLALVTARAALERLSDSGLVLAPGGPSDDSPAVVRAGLLRDLSAGSALTGDARYRDAAATLTHTLVRDFALSDPQSRFADRDAYVLGAVLDAAAAVLDTAAERGALAQLDTLLTRVYVRGRGVRHAPRGSVHGLLQDQVQVAGAALAAYEATGERHYLDVARDLAAVLERDFADPLGGYWDEAATDPAAPALADRTKQVLDDLLPGANAWAARILLQLSEDTGDARYRRRAEATLEAFAAATHGQGARAATYLDAARGVLGPR